MNYLFGQSNPNETKQSPLRKLPLPSFMQIKEKESDKF